ncbi:mutagen-sensitive 301 [Carabus blaptoides fortunei]
MLLLKGKCIDTYIIWALSTFALALDFLVEEYAAATIEKALGLINSLMETGRLKEIGLVVVDELHLMGEQDRGVNLEILLTKLMYARESIQIVGMSATIGNLPEVCKFLKAEVYTKDFRPVELKEYVKCGKQIYEVNRKAKSIEESLVPARTVNFQYTENASTLDPDRLSGLVMEVVPAGSCLVFCASKKNCENVAILLCRIMFKTMLDHKKIAKENLLKQIQAEGSLCPVLKRTVPFGVAYHHSGKLSTNTFSIQLL